MGGSQPKIGDMGSIPNVSWTFFSSLLSFWRVPVLWWIAYTCIHFLQVTNDLTFCNTSKYIVQLINCTHYTVFTYTPHKQEREGGYESAHILLFKEHLMPHAGKPTLPLSQLVCPPSQLLYLHLYLAPLHLLLEGHELGVHWIRSRWIILPLIWVSYVNRNWCTAGSDSGPSLV